jgi:hypothetical protein
MGFMTREEMAVEVSMNLGGKTPAPDRLVLWLNFALYNLASFVRLDDLRETVDIIITQGETNYDIPAGIDMLGIVAIEINGRKMLKMKRQFSESPGGVALSQAEPTHYLRRNTEFVIWPEPDADYTGYIDYIKTPDRLTSGTQKTTFSPNWDAALVMLATHHGHLSLGNQDEADRWLGRFLGYAGSRIKEEDIDADMPKGGLNVAWDVDDIHEAPDHYPY